MSSPPDNRYNDWDIPPKEQWTALSSWTDKRHIKTDEVWAARPSDAREKALLDMVAATSREVQVEAPKGVTIYHSPYPNRYYNAHTDNLVFSTADLSPLSPDDVKAAVWNMLLDKKHKAKDAAVNRASRAITAGAIAGSLAESITGHGSGAQLESALIGLTVPTAAIAGGETYKEMSKISRAIQTAEATGKDATRNALELDPKIKNPRRMAGIVERELEKRNKERSEDNKSR